MAAPGLEARIDDRRPGRPGGPGRDPSFEGGDLVVAELPTRGHLEFARLADRLDQEAPVRVPGIDRRAGLSPFQGRLPGVEPKPPLLLLGAVAWAALLDQERADFLLEGVGVLGRRPGDGPREAGQERHDREEEGSQRRASWGVAGSGRTRKMTGGLAWPPAAAEVRWKARSWGGRPCRR